MEITKTLYVKKREEWRAWLERHHATEDDIWLVYYKKATGKPSIPYDDAVEEALCFGWIDSQQKGIDEESYAQRFTPRKPGANWSEANKERVRRLIAAGRMTPAGLAKLEGRSAQAHPDLGDAPQVLLEDDRTEQALRAGAVRLGNL